MSVRCDFRFDDEGNLVYAFVAYDRISFFKDKVYAKSIILKEQADQFFSKQVYKRLPDYVDLKSVEILSRTDFDAYLRKVFAEQVGPWSLEVGCAESALLVRSFTFNNPKIKKSVPTDFELAVSKEKYVSIASNYESIIWCSEFLKNSTDKKLSGAEYEAIDLLSKTKLYLPMRVSEGYEGAGFLVASRFFVQGEDWPKHKGAQSYPLIQIRRDVLQSMSGIGCEGDVLQILNFKNDKHMPVSRVLSATDALVPNGVAKSMAVCNRKYEWMDGGIRCANGYAVEGISAVEIQSDLHVYNFFKLKKHIPPEYEIRFAAALQGLDLTRFHRHLGTSIFQRFIRHRA